MKYAFRLTLLIALAFLMVVSPATVSTRAQESVCVAGLEAADCELLNQAMANQATVTSFVMDYNVNLEVAGTPEAVSMTVEGSGPIDVSKMTGTDQAAMLQGLVMSSILSASLTQGEQTQAGTFEFRIVDGTMYFKGDVATQDMWMKVDLAQAAAAGSSQLPLDPSNMGSMGAFADPEVMTALMALTTAEGFITGEASDGDTVDGAATRKITVNIDFGVLLDTLFSEEGRPILKALAEAQGQTMTDEQLDAAIQQGAAQLAMLKPTLDNTNFSLSWWVGKDDAKFRGFGLNFDTKVDPTLASMAGGTGTEEITVDFDFMVTLSALGEAVTVEPVADAQEVPLN